MTSSSQKHLAILLPSLHKGGAEHIMVKLASGFEKRGYKVDMVLVQAEGFYLTELPSSVRIVDLGASRIALSLPALIRYLKREKPDVLLCGLVTNIIAILAKSISKVPTRLIVSERSAISVEMRFYASDIRMRILPYLIQHLYPKADSIIAVSNSVADDLSRNVQIPRERVQVIYNPVVTPEFENQTHASLVHPWFEAGHLPVILSVGRLMPVKDFATLIKAFDQVRQEYDARLLILGEGEQRPGLESLIAELHLQQQVCLPGFVPNPYPYMRCADAFVSSSLWEGLPGALIEAMYCGAPLIATDCPGGSREVLADGKYGRLVPVGDIDSLAQAIKMVLQHRPPPPTFESWQPFELNFVIDQYARVLFED